MHGKQVSMGVYTLHLCPSPVPCSSSVLMFLHILCLIRNESVEMLVQNALPHCAHTLWPVLSHVQATTIIYN